MGSSYVPLWCKSNFSFLEGASHPQELVEAAHRLGLPGLALTDRDGVHGVVRAFVRARELGVHLIYGSQVTVTSDGIARGGFGADSDAYGFAQPHHPSPSRTRSRGARKTKRAARSGGGSGCSQPTRRRRGSSCSRKTATATPTSAGC